MHVLVVSVLPTPDSLGTALRDVAVEALTEAGHTVEESDLYAMDFDPVLRGSDYGEETADITPLTDRAGAAMRAGSTAPDVAEEQRKIAAADAVVFVFPLWWFGLPAMLKGWIDRVWVQGFAFGTSGPGGPRLRYGDGGLAGKVALPIVTAGDRPGSFAPRGVNGDVEELLFPVLHGTFWYCGMETLQPVFAPGVGYPGWDGMDRAVQEIRAGVAALADPDGAGRVRYRALTSGDYGRDRLLREDLRPGETGVRIHRA